MSGRFLRVSQLFDLEFIAKRILISSESPLDAEHAPEKRSETIWYLRSVFYALMLPIAIEARTGSRPL